MSPHTVNNSPKAFVFCSLTLVRASIFTVFFAASLSACVSQQGKSTLNSNHLSSGQSNTAESFENSPTSSQSSIAVRNSNDAEGQTQEEPNWDLIPGVLPPAAEQAVHPLAALSDKEVEALLKTGKTRLGSASVGRTNAGSLVGEVQMQDNPYWNVVNPKECYGTAETVAYLGHAIAKVNERFPNTPIINIGDISKKGGGHLSPHVSHQSGRDVDLGFYYLDGSRWYSKANIKNLDVERTWALVRHTITETDVQVIFLDRSLQTILRDYATEIGEDEHWLDQVFGGPSSNLRPMIIHERGHKSHLHIRYYNPIAQETGRRIYNYLLKSKKIVPQTYFVKYKVKRGDSLIRISKKFKTKVSIIKKANRLKTSRIVAGRTYKIPRKGAGRARMAQTKKLVLPARRIPQSQQLAPIVGTSGSVPSSVSAAYAP